MKAEELRIGNFVKYKEEIIKLGTFDYSSFTYEKDKTLNYIVGAFKSLQPIELTEEWLLKMGFEKDHLYFSKGSFHYHMHGIVFIGNDHVSSGHVDSYLKTVHQLQNLYFALTGEELTIKN